MLRLLQAPPADTPFGLRDRALLETLYSAGLRVSELTGLNVEDVDLAEGLATVRGKGRRERLALLGPPAQKALKRWLEGRAAVMGEFRQSTACPLPEQERHATQVAERRPAAREVPQAGWPRPAHESPHAAP